MGFAGSPYLAQAGIVGRSLPRVALGQTHPRRPGVGELRPRKLGRQLCLHVPRVLAPREAQLFVCWRGFSSWRAGGGGQRADRARGNGEGRGRGRGEEVA